MKSANEARAEAIKKQILKALKELADLIEETGATPAKVKQLDYLEQKVKRLAHE